MHITLFGGIGNDSLYGSDGEDLLYGEDGHDILDGGWDYHADYLYGGRGNDRMWGRYGNDYLRGDNGHDQLIGGYGNDNLNGGNDNDTLWGAATNNESIGSIDTLTGGNGNDLFVLGDSTGRFYDNPSASNGNLDYAYIADFNWTIDTIQLNGSSSDYSLSIGSVNGVSGTFVNAIEPGSWGGDRVAFIANNTNNFDLNSSYVDYVV